MIAQRRLFLVLAGYAALFGLIAARLYFLQIMRADVFASLAHKEYTTTATLPTQRGALRDRHNKPLALAQQQLSAFIDRTHVQDTKGTEGFLQEKYPAVFEQWQAAPNQNFFWIAHHITHDKQEELRAQCPDVHFIFEPSRWYRPPYMAEVTGCSNIYTQGIAGIECWADRHLAGTPATMQYHKKAIAEGHYFVEHVIKSGTQGTSMTLCVDQALHFVATRALEAHRCTHKALRAGALIINPQTGHIISLAQTPSYNPNTPVAAAQRKNHLTSSCYEFGSVMSLFSALAALNHELTTPDALVNCQGKRGYLNGHNVENESEQTTVPFWQAVARGGNVGTAKVCKRLGCALYDHLSRLGFGTPTGIELPDERSGFVNPPERWSSASPLSLSYGYEVMATPLHVAKALSIIANGGHLIKPTLLLLDRPPARGMQLYPAGTIAQIKEILHRACQEYNIVIPGYDCSGIAGSAKLLRNGAYTKKAGLFTFAGIIEKGEYQRVIVTFIEQPTKKVGQAHTVMAPLFTALANATVLHEQLCPPPY